ncbi:MAG TPA: CheR family methyltransferase [Terriglobales bacterium]
MSDSQKPKQDLSLAEIVEELASRCALDLRGYKHGTLQRRMHKRMQRLSVSSYYDYLDLIRRTPGEANELLSTVLINVTEFFRDAPAWEALRTSVLPSLLERLQPGDAFRAWCPACASGEEPYSLAILLAEHFGKRLPEQEIKIYATDIDEEALNSARRGEYPWDRLRRVRPQWRQKYFTGSGATARIVREVRKMVIFGRSNVLTDAPISHCSLVVCRNLLIYFDAASQREIMKRLHYALDPDGVLFLGKAESKLSDSQVFQSINARWRIFRKLAPGQNGETRAAGGREVRSMVARKNHEIERELRNRRLQERYILESVQSALILLDAADVVLTHNDGATRIWSLGVDSIEGQPIHSTPIAAKCPELSSRLEESRRNPQETVVFRAKLRNQADGRDHVIVINLRAMLDESRQRTGTVMHCDDVTHQDAQRDTSQQLESTGEELKSANERLETSNEELHSTNEELETTNEELQSTNEELETTNEELQSTNEELETANEELQSLNEELENMNEELEHRTKEMHQHTERYAESLRSLPFPVMLLDGKEKVQLWNSAAQKLLGIGSSSVVGVDFRQMPLPESLRKIFLRRCQAVLLWQEASVLRNQRVKENGRDSYDVHFAPVSHGEAGKDGVLVIFGPCRGDRPAPASKAAARDGGGRARRTTARKKTSARAGHSKKRR